MFSRISNINPLYKLALLGSAVCLSYKRINYQSQDTFQHLRYQSQDSIVKFQLNGKVIGQGAILNGGIIVTHPQVLENHQPQVQAIINNKQYQYKVLRIDEGIAILQLPNYSKGFELGQPQIGINAYVMGHHDGINEYQKCPIQDTFSSIKMNQVGQNILNTTSPFFILNKCTSIPGSPVLNKSGQLIGIMDFEDHGRTKVISADLFNGVEGQKDINKAYLGCSLKTSEDGGAFIIKINSDSPAELAGLKLGEIIKSVNNIPIQTGMDVPKLLGYKQHQLVNMTISRDGKLRDVIVQL